jgi:hypothetical protein
MPGLASFNPYGRSKVAIEVGARATLVRRMEPEMTADLARFLQRVSTTQ